MYDFDERLNTVLNTTKIEPRKQEVLSISVTKLEGNNKVDELVDDFKMGLKFIPKIDDSGVDVSTDVIVPIAGKIGFMGDVYAFDLTLKVNKKDARGEDEERFAYMRMFNDFINDSSSENSVIYNYIKRYLRLLCGWKYEHRYNMYKKEGKSLFVQLGDADENDWMHVLKGKYFNEVEEYVERLTKFKHKNCSLSHKYDKENNIHFYILTDMIDNDQFIYAVTEYEESRDNHFLAK